MSKALTIYEANHIQCALDNREGVVETWLSRTTPEMVKKLERSGLKVKGYKPRERDGVDINDPWIVFEIQDRDKAAKAIFPFRIPVNRINHWLTPIEHDSPWAKHVCPECGGTDIDWNDGDSVPVPVLPLGIDSYGELDTFLCVGQCKCGQPLYTYEFGFSSIPYPDGEDCFALGNIEGRRKQLQTFKAEAEGLSPWFVARMWFSNSYRNKGPFIADFHQFGPFKLDQVDELSGENGVSRCITSHGSNKWDIGRELFHNLAGEAMSQLKSFSETYFEFFGEEFLAANKSDTN